MNYVTKAAIKDYGKNNLNVCPLQIQTMSPLLTRLFHFQ